MDLSLTMIDFASLLLIVSMSLYFLAEITGR
jgi:hypothetical protein